MIDQETGWFEIKQYKYKQAYKIEELVYKKKLCRYPRPTIVTYDHRNEFLVREFKNN